MFVIYMFAVLPHKQTNEKYPRNEEFKKLLKFKDWLLTFSLAFKIHM